MAGYSLLHNIKTIVVTFFYELSNKAKKNVELHQFGKNTQFWAYGAHPRSRQTAETWIFWGCHCMNKNRLLEFWRNFVSMRIKSHHTEAEKRKILTKILPGTGECHIYRRLISGILGLSQPYLGQILNLNYACLRNISTISQAFFQTFD